MIVFSTALKTGYSSTLQNGKLKSIFEPKLCILVTFHKLREFARALLLYPYLFHWICLTEIFLLIAASYF